MGVCIGGPADGHSFTTKTQSANVVVAVADGTERVWYERESGTFYRNRFLNATYVRRLDGDFDFVEADCYAPTKSVLVLERSFGALFVDAETSCFLQDQSGSHFSVSAEEYKSICEKVAAEESREHQ